MIIVKRPIYVAATPPAVDERQAGESLNVSLKK
jgi:hypothetical protein